MKIELFPLTRLESVWRQDKKCFVDGDAADPPKCLRCGHSLSNHLMVNALSRYANVYICEACRMDEALRDAAHAPMPLTDWESVRKGRVEMQKKNSICYLVLECAFPEVFQRTYTPPMQAITRPVSEIAYSRSDYDGCKWWTTWHGENSKKAMPELAKEIDNFQNTLFKLPAFQTPETMRRFCKYAQSTNEPTEFNLYSETKHLYIWIRLITRFRDYNLYVHYYDKMCVEGSK